MMIIITDWIVAVVAVLLADFIVDVARGPLSRYGVNVFWKDQIRYSGADLSNCLLSHSVTCVSVVEREKPITDIPR